MATSSNGPTKLETLLEMLHSEVLRERDLVAVHIEANRALETMLRREQSQHEETKALLEKKMQQQAVLLGKIASQNQLLESMANSALASEVDSGQIHQFLQKTAAHLTMDLHHPDIIPMVNDSANSAESASQSDSMHEDERIQQLLRALQL